MDINEVIEIDKVFLDKTIIRDGFVFTCITHPANIYDAIVIKYPMNVKCFSPWKRGSQHSLQRQIDFINEHKIEKAMIIAENIDFITICPSLKHLDIIPADSSKDNFDYSPLYDMPCIKSLSCCTIYGAKGEHSTSIDCSKIKGLEDIHVTNSKYQNFEKIRILKQLAVSDYEKEDLTDLFESNQLDTLTVITSKIKSLEGIQKSNKMQCLYLYYNRRLQDISALKKVKSTLRALCIENSSKIKDFSVLGELENLEYLVLFGSNNLADLSFLKTMKNLKTFIFTVNVLDGDLTPCLDLSYVYCSKMRKHYNLKDKDLPRGEYVRGNENIDLWRQHR